MMLEVAPVLLPRDLGVDSIFISRNTHLRL